MDFKIPSSILYSSNLFLSTPAFFYFGDEFYALSIPDGPDQVGNDYLIARAKDFEIRTISVNHKHASLKNTTWIGRTPQALLEFLEEIVLDFRRYTEIG